MIRAVFIRRAARRAWRMKTSAVSPGGSGDVGGGIQVRRPPAGLPLRCLNEDVSEQLTMLAP
jgi:hypothetical protein